MEKFKLNIYKIIIINSILIVVLFIFINALAYGLLLYKHTVMDKLPFKYFNYRTNSGTLRVNKGIPELLNMQPDEIKALLKKEGILYDLKSIFPKSSSDLRL